MTYEQLKDYYLCSIGQNDMVTHIMVGKYDGVRKSFSFPNGSYGNTELYREPNNNSIYVITATCLQVIDDFGLLYCEDAEKIRRHL